jgi:hypothetical protein
MGFNSAMPLFYLTPDTGHNEIAARSVGIWNFGFEYFAGQQCTLSQPVTNIQSPAAPEQRAY